MIRRAVVLMWVAGVTLAAEPGALRVTAGEAQLTGTVQRVDRRNREIDVRMPNGNAATFKVSPDVGALKSVKKGSQLSVRYLESVAIALHDADQKPPLAPAQTVHVAAAGTPPVAVGTQLVSATVDGIDRHARTVTLKDASGNRFIVRVRPGLDAFDTLRPGDKVVADVTQAVAVEVRQA